MGSKILSWLLSGTLGGALYLLMEGVWRRGYAHVSMALVGAVVLWCVGAMNQIPAFYRLPMFWQAFLAMLLIFAIEFGAGLILNLWLGLGVWDYTGRPWNILGQIWLPYGVLWFCLAPFAIWLEDALQWVFYDWHRAFGREPDKPLIPRYRLVSIYKDLFRKAV